MGRLDEAEIAEQGFALAHRQFGHIQCSCLGASTEALQTLGYFPGLGVVQHKNEFLALLIPETGADDVEVLDFNGLEITLVNPFKSLNK